MILKSENKDDGFCGRFFLSYWFWAAVRQPVFFGFEVWDKESRRRSGGNVGISPVLRDFQGLVGRKGNPVPGFPCFPPGCHFHRSPVCLPLVLLWFQRAGRNGDSILHCRSSLAFASPIFRAHWVSLI